MIVTGVNLLFLPAMRQKTRNLIISGTENQGFLVETFRGIQVLKTTQATPQAWSEYQGNNRFSSNRDRSYCRWYHFPTQSAKFRSNCACW